MSEWNPVNSTILLGKSGVRTSAPGQVGSVRASRLSHGRGAEMVYVNTLLCMIYIYIFIYLFIHIYILV